MTDIEQMASIFRLVTPRSLVLVDEFGKGTDVTGMSLNLDPAQSC